MSTQATISKPGRDEHDASLLRVEQVHEKLAALVRPVSGSERVAIRAAQGRVLDAPVISSMNVPPYANSAMDGYALRGTDLPAEGQIALRVIGTSFAGEPFVGAVNAGECIRIMTGAKMPEGADTVIMQEHAQRQNDQITIGDGHKPGQHVRHPGEDMAIGRAVLEAGQKIGAAEIGLLASLGIAEVNVKRRLRVAFFSTGDELRGVGEQLGPGQIYDSNRYTLYSMLSAQGMDLIDMGVIRDDQAAVEQAFNDAAHIADVVITSGGVSVGEADYVKTTLDKLGQVDFWRIAMKPGKPLAFGRLGDALFFGLPGNPVSVMATFYLFVLPSLRHMQGQAYQLPITYHAISEGKLKKAPGRTDYQRGVLKNKDGKLLVDGTGMQASHILSGMSRANCFIVLPLESAGVEAGSEVEVIPFTGLMQ